jgi:hypothetical protein
MIFEKIFLINMHEPEQKKNQRKEQNESKIFHKKNVKSSFVNFRNQIKKKYPHPKHASKTHKIS